MAGSALTLSGIASALAKAVDVDHVADLRNKARAIEVYTKQTKDCKEIERNATIIRLRAERRLGELLAKTVKAGNPKNAPGGKLPPGITGKQSAAWQQIAKLPERDFEKYLTTRRLSTKSLVKLAAKRQRSRQTGPATGCGIITGNMLVLRNRLEHGRVDLFLSDPPYSDVDAYENLAELAATKLRDGGLCVAYAANAHLPELLGRMSKHLRYWWTIAAVRQGVHNAVHARSVQSTWRPIVIFAKGKPQLDYFTDCMRCTDLEKDLHDWQQPQSEAEYLISKFSEPGELVVDPYCGSGTTLAAAKKLGRGFIGCEINASTARGARKRLAG